MHWHNNKTTSNACNNRRRGILSCFVWKQTQWESVVFTLLIHTSFRWHQKISPSIGENKSRKKTKKSQNKNMKNMCDVFISVLRQKRATPYAYWRYVTINIYHWRCNIQISLSNSRIPLTVTLFVLSRFNQFLLGLSVNWLLLFWFYSFKFVILGCMCVCICAYVRPCVVCCLHFSFYFSFDNKPHKIYSVCIY